MIYRQQVLPQYSQTEVDMHIGAIGYMRYFQDATTRLLLSVGKGNDTIPSDYGICWIVSKYQLQILERAGVERALTIETWIEPEKSKVRLHPNLRICDENGTVLARGQMELCLAHIEDNRIALLTEIDFPFDICEEPGIEHPKTRKLRIDESACEPSHVHTVRYSDLDNNRHMNNLRFVDVAIDAFSSEFYEMHPITELALEYLGQCHEGDVLRVTRHISDGHAGVIVRNANGETALKAELSF